MKLFADENVEGAIVHWLRDQGHDVIWAAESYQSEPDVHLLSLANESERILITHDLDFGDLIIRGEKLSQGIILIRATYQNQHELLSIVKTWWLEIEANVSGNFITLLNERIRIRKL